MPVEARLIQLGRIEYAVTRGDLTFEQANELQARLDKQPGWREAMEYAVGGEPFDD